MNWREKRSFMRFLDEKDVDDMKNMIKGEIKMMMYNEKDMVEELCFASYGMIRSKHIWHFPHGFPSFGNQHVHVS